MVPKQIIITKGEEFKEKITGIDENNFFYNVYAQARDRLYDIVSSSESLSEFECDNIETKFYNNNIIAFCGDRGQGKSSAMLTFSDALKKYTNRNGRDTDSDINKFFDYKKSDRSFFVLNPIDPTQLENNDDILKIVVSRIFVEFKKFWQNDNHSQESQRSKSNIELKNEMLSLFQKCYKHIITIKNSNALNFEDISFEDSLEDLARLGDSSNLKKDLYRLIKNFFRIKFNEQEYKKYMLVIQIDDTDLNVEKAYEIVEDLRKYLMIPNVVILMATKLEQLTKAVEQEYRRAFELLIANGRISRNELQQMASKYIDKLIPDGRKIYLPIISTKADSSEEQVEILYIDQDGKNILKQCKDIQDQIFNYLFLKTGIIFVKPDVGVHRFIPKTMRELVNLLAMLSKMDDIKDIKLIYEAYNENEKTKNSNKIDIDTRLTNLTMFENYFMHTWIPNNLDDGYILYLSNLLNTSNDLKHQQIITDMFDVIENLDVYSLVKPSIENSEDKREFLKSRQKEKLEFIKSNLLQYSIGDVLELIEKVENTYQKENVYLFTFSIKIIYTITLNKIFLNSVKYNDNESLKEFIGIDIFRKSICNEYIKSFDIGIKSYQNLCSEKESCINKITDFVFSGYIKSNFYYPEYKEEKSLNNAPFTNLKFGISFPLLKYIYNSTENSKNTFVFFFLNLEVIDALQDHLQKYSDIKGESSLWNRLQLFYFNIERFIFATKRNELDKSRYKPKFEPYEFINGSQIEYILKNVMQNKNYYENLFSLINVKKSNSSNDIIKQESEIIEIRNMKSLIKSLKYMRMMLDSESTQDNAKARIIKFIKRVDNIKNRYNYDEISLNYIIKQQDNFIVEQGLKEGNNLQLLIRILNNMDTFIESISLITLDGE